VSYTQSDPLCAKLSTRSPRIERSQLVFTLGLMTAMAFSIRRVAHSPRCVYPLSASGACLMDVALVTTGMD